ncbi:hypothetical protein [Luteolibacter sp. Populi]|uniref:hypothetical protein n=1 Tax=Luteolibacter sp. Populi TaxID=3230487 RepID=UPI003465FEAB
MVFPRAGSGIAADYLDEEAKEEPEASTAIVGPIADGSPVPAIEPPPQPDFVVESTITRSVFVEKAPEMAGLPSVKGRINVTLNRVEDPRLPNPPPPPPLPPLDPDDPVVQARLAEMRENYKRTELVFVSAQVYDHACSLVRWYPNGQPRSIMSAWSNIDFNHFSGFAACQIKGVDGEIRTYGFLMGTGNCDTTRLEQLAAQRGLDYEPPDIPALPPLADGPAFVLAEGDSSNQEAMRIIDDMHELYRVEGLRMAQAYEGRTRAQVERLAFLLANPPQPKDVTIHYWKRERPANGETQAGEGSGE